LLLCLTQEWSTNTYACIVNQDSGISMLFADHFRNGTDFCGLADVGLVIVHIWSYTYVRKSYSTSARKRNYVRNGCAGGYRSRAITEAEVLAASRTIAAPIPLEPPVTTTISLPKFQLSLVKLLSTTRERKLLILRMTPHAKRTFTVEMNVADAAYPRALDGKTDWTPSG
jgi:hypothetical protein